MRNIHPSDVLEQLGHPEQLVTVERLYRAEGPDRGAGVLLVRNPGGISMEILLDRALDIGWSDAPGHPLAWKSPRGHISSHRFDSREAGWLATFPGGLLSTCGLRTTGMPSTVDGVHYGLHGDVASLPAEHVSYGITRFDGATWITVEGVVVDGALGTPPLVLRRTLSINTESSELRVEDRVTNEGYVTTGHMYRHHFNLGFPAIQSGTLIESTATPFATRDSSPITEFPWTLRGPSELEPSEHAESVLYCHAGDGPIVTRATSPDGKWIELEAPAEQWPYLLLWRDPRPGVNVLGVEPSTSLDDGRAAAEASEDVRWLEPGQTVSYSSSLRAGSAPSQ